MDASSERDDVATQSASTLGQALQQARTARSLSIEQLATELRIEATQLAALEQDEFDRIGPPVFVKGYLKQYGQRLGLDHRELLGMYYAQVETREVVIQPSRTIKLRDERQITIWIVAGLLLAAVIAALAVWWFNNGQPLSFSSRRSADSTLLPAAEVEQPAAPSVDAAPDTPREARDAAALFAAAAAARRPASQVARAGEPADMRSLHSEAGAAAPRGSPSGSTESRQVASAVSTATAHGAATVRLTLTFQEESWAEVTGADGERLFYGLGAAGRHVELAGAPPFAVVLGNVGGVSLAVNGVVQEIPRGRGNLARFSVTAPASAD